MTAVAPTVAWANIKSFDTLYNIDGSGVLPTSIAMVRPDILHLWVQVTGGVSFTVGGSVVKGTHTVTLSGFGAVADLSVGQLVSGIWLPGYPDGTTYQNYISSITLTGGVPSSFTFFNAEGATGDDLGALSTNPMFVFVSDPAPSGTLDFSVSPSTGVTITDQNADASFGTGNVNHIGDGTAVCNLLGQGEGGCWISFASAGTFVISASYTSTDVDYLDATISNPLTIVVT
jgi:hypothetical protein